MPFWKKKKKPPPLPPTSNPESEDGLTGQGIPTHGFIFCTSVLPNFWQGARSDLWKMMADPEMGEGIAGLWTMASLTVPPAFQQMDMSELSCQIIHHQGWKLAVFQLPPVVYPFDVRYCVTAFGSLAEDVAADDPAWETAPYRLFFQQAGMGIMELKEWRDDKSISHGPSEEENFDAFMQSVVRLLSGTNAAIVENASEMGAQMDQAMERARSEIDEVLKQYLAGEFDNFSVKAPVSDGTYTEHFWLEDVTFENGKFVGNLDAPPQHVQGYSQGQQVEVQPWKISDYSAMKDGKLHGYYTTRVLLPTMPPEQAEQLQAILAPID